MRNPHKTRNRSRGYWLAAGGVAFGLVLAACGSSSTPAATRSPSTASTAAAAAGSATTAAPKAVTISSGPVAGYGTVLVNGSDGKTLYLLTSEEGGKLTCTDDNGCTKVWPDTELPEGVAAATAGSGVHASMLATVKSSSGHLYPTYAGYPLYEFSHDMAPGQANGEGITSFGGTWYVVGTDGKPITTKVAGASTNGY